jgi:HAD superfamily hydrolase (TIGR01549 family)
MRFEQPQSIRTVFFDAGFTLLRPTPSDAEICLEVCQSLGLHVQLDAMEQRMKEADDYYFSQVRLNRHLWSDERAISEMWVGYFKNMLRPLIEEHDEARLQQLGSAIASTYGEPKRWETYPDVLPTLEPLRRAGYTMGVISDWGIVLGPILRHLNLIQYFDTVIISAAARYAKPAPQLYDLALQRTNSIADYSMHIGDTYVNDVLGARSVGITPVLLDRPHRVEESIVDCLLVHSLDEVLDVLEVARV